MSSLGKIPDHRPGPRSSRLPGTRAIILAAGRGSRLGSLTESQPKCLVKVGEASILERQLDALGRVPGINGVTVVVGYRADLVETELERLKFGKPVETVFNPFFGEVNALASLWLALQRRPGDFAVVNGDTFFTASCLAHFIDDDADLTLLFSKKAQLRDDAVKVAAVAGALSEIGKNVPISAAAGESAGLFRCAGEGAVAAVDLAERMLREPKSLHAYWYMLVRGLAAEGRRIALRECEARSWFEVDDRVDLEAARAGTHAWAEVAAEPLRSVPSLLPPPRPLAGARANG